MSKRIQQSFKRRLGKTTIGYSTTSKAFRIYNEETHRVVKSRKATFIETLQMVVPNAEQESSEKPSEHRL